MTAETRGRPTYCILPIDSLDSKRCHIFYTNGMSLLPVTLNGNPIPTRNFYTTLMYTPRSSRAEVALDVPCQSKFFYLF